MLVLVDSKNLPLAPCDWQGFEEGGGDRPLLPFRDQYGKRTVPGSAKPAIRYRQDSYQEG